jgi:hypothetical protein
MEDEPKQWIPIEQIGRYLIDPPGHFSPLSQWREHRQSLDRLEPGDPSVISAKELADDQIARKIKERAALVYEIQERAAFYQQRATAPDDTPASRDVIQTEANRLADLLWRAGRALSD